MAEVEAPSKRVAPTARVETICSPPSDFAHVPLFVSHNYSGLTIGLVN